jgi:TRAP-type C4-dicarboxylate transport system permease small subunit
MLLMGLLATLVILVVIMRYCFSITFPFLESFITLLLASCTFWAVGICLSEHEHIVIDVLYNRMPPRLKRIVTLANTLIIFIINCAIVYYSALWIAVAGKPISPGLKIPMKYVYGIMPVGFSIAALCTLALFFSLLTKKEDKP